MLSILEKYPDIIPAVSEYVSTRRIFGIYGAAAWPNSMHVYTKINTENLYVYIYIYIERIQ